MSTYNHRDAQDANKILFTYYLYFGRPAGCIVEPRLSKSNNEYIMAKGVPGSHNSAAKSILREIRTCLGIGDIDHEFWCFFGQIVAEFKKRGGRGIFDLRDRFPNIFQELGGFGKFRVGAICNAKLIHILPCETPIKNDGVYANLVKFHEDDNYVLCTVNQKLYPINKLLIIE